MNFEMNETERMLSDSLIRFRAEAATLDAAAQWQRCREMGWQAASIPEEFGGFGMGLVGPMLIAEQLSAVLSPLCWQRQAILPALALTALRASGDDAPLERFLDGHPVRFVLDRDAAQPGAAPIIRLGRDADGAPDMTFAATPDLLAQLCTVARVTAAADHLGAMQRLFDMTLDYTRTRHQFGRPLSSFQALQHRLVQMFITLDESRALVMAAAMAASEAMPNADHLAAAAWNKVQTGGQRIAQEAIQMHGGIGMTEECQVGHYVKRMLSNSPCL